MAFTISTGSVRRYNEGNFITFQWIMEKPDRTVIRNTTVPWTIVGLDASDVVGGQLSGTVAINQFGVGTLQIRLAEDQRTEGLETFYIESNANFTRFISNQVTVVDTSVSVRPSPPPSPPPTPVPPPVPVPPPSGDRTHTGSRQADNIVGTGVKDTLRVTSGADRFDGGDSIDTFDLGNLYTVLKEGERLLIGRELADTYADIIVRADLTKTSRSVDLATTFTRYQLFEKTTFDINTTLVNVENLRGTEFADSFRGNASANYFRSFAGRDTLAGLEGNDTLDGGEGNDVLDGGEGTDTAVLAGTAQDYRFSRVGTSVEAVRTISGRTERDLLTSIERIQFDNSNVELSSLLPPLRTHFIRALTTSVDEGSLARFEVNTSGYAPGEQVTYSIQGISGADVLNVPLSSSVAVDSAGRALIEFRITADNLTEGVETVVVRVADSAASMVVNDTSLNAIRTGTDRDDLLTGSSTGDLMDGRGGNDRLDGYAGNDTMRGGIGNDQLYGGDGDDELDGQQGSDFMAGGAGNDTYFVDDGSDVISEIIGTQGGVDQVFSSINYTLGLDVENLTLTGTALTATGNNLNNRLVGNAGNNLLRGLDGNDLLLGGDGSDRLEGGFGADTLSGGAGGDSFLYSQTSQSSVSSALRDVVTDFQRGLDKIDLSAIDARFGSGTANDAFVFLSSAPVTALQANGAVWFINGILYASTDTSLAAEFSVALTNVTGLNSGDLIL